MPDMNKRIAIIGAGAVGSYIGGQTARAGADVTLIDPWPIHVDAMRKHGLSVSGMVPGDRYTVAVNAMHVCDVQKFAMQKPIDIAFICTSSCDTDWATLLIRPYLAPGGFVVSVQNGINEERIATHVGWRKVLGGIASLISVELFQPGSVRRTAPPGGERHTVFRVGEVHGRVTRRAEQLAGLLRCVDSAKVTTNLWGERWSKLVVNSMRNAVSAITGMTGNERDLNDITRWLGIRLGSEAVRVGQALGFELETMQRMKPETLARAGEGDCDARREIDDILVSYARMRADGQRPSTAQDILRGRRTEIDFINGYVAAKGAEIGVPAPLQAAVTALVKKIERRELAPGPALVAGL